MSTLASEIASLERRRDEMLSGARPFCTQKYGDIIKTLAGFKQRQLNHENMQAEIAKHMQWIEDADGIDTATEVYGV